MTSVIMPDRVGIVGGVDTHADTHVVAAVDHNGAVLGNASFKTTAAGYASLLAWLNSYGPVIKVGVEGTGSWGSGLARHLADRGVDVREVIRPNRQTRRRYGKSDNADAVAAARAVLSGQATGQPRGNTGVVECLRLLKVARRSAVKQRTMVANQIHGLVVTCPENLQATLRGLTLRRMVGVVSRYRPGAINNPTAAAKLALRTLGRRHQQLSEEIKTLDVEIQTLVEQAAPPGLLDMCGVGPQTAADLIITIGSNPDRIRKESSLAALCGTSPVDMSSGKQQRHRLNRGGDRQANAALYRIAVVRLRYHQPTRQYADRRTREGLTKPEIIRCLKRYIAREIWEQLAQQNHTTKPT
ncbi:MAG: IS110 family transposase [Acidimicrobiia bacterium]